LTDKNAFTLAEILIVIGIVGVISAITLPTLITSYQKKLVALQVKKAYSVLSEAVKRSEYDNDSTSGWDMKLSADEFTSKYLAAYLPIARTNAKAIHNSINYKFLNGNQFNLAILTTASSSVLVLKDGSFLFVDGWSNGEQRGIAIDINGYSAPNTRGKDVFEFLITKDKGVRPKGYEYTLEQIKDPTFKSSCQKSTVSQAYSCTSWIAREGWKIPKDYPW
jgi:prepilin-type N-terminal cleavage/methylation domain-containing protein